MNLRPLAVALSVGTAACVTVRPVAAPVNFIPQQNPEIVWITAQSGEVIPVSRPVLRGDTVTGHWIGTSEPVSVPLPQVQMVYARQRHHARTALLIASATALAGFVAWRATRSGGVSSDCVFDPRSGWDCTP
ncbi:MAG: hypothetical protein Q8Q14_16955 [Gemmatimonadales bacterium]|nr:hypothetical protein [Gemmatimonadales bacterium]